MSCLKVLFVVSFVVAFLGVSKVEAAARQPREVEAAPETNQLEKVQDQLMTAFDSFKKSMEELASKFNTEELIQGVQNLTSRLETYAKQAADQFASTASGADTEQKKEEAAP